MFAHLCRAYRAGPAPKLKQPSEREALLVVRHIMLELSKALHFVAAHDMPACVRWVDAATRRDIRCGAPGDREVHRHRSMLDLGLRIASGPVDIQVKDLLEIYGYWCYLRIVQIIAEETGSEILVAGLIAALGAGRHVHFEKVIPLRLMLGKTGPCKIDVEFRPEEGPGVIPFEHTPEILISLRASDQRRTTTAVEAKYLVDVPPAHLAALHRGTDGTRVAPRVPPRPPRRAIYTVARYPNGVDSSAQPRACARRKTKQAGVGIISAQPEHTAALHVWLRDLLTRSG